MSNRGCRSCLELKNHSALAPLDCPGSLNARWAKDAEDGENRNAKPFLVMTRFGEREPYSALG
jgi:hypothetical protein